MIDLIFVMAGMMPFVAGIYFVEPIGFRDDCGPMDESLGFVMGEHRYAKNSGALHFIFISAKEALDAALDI